MNRTGLKNKGKGGEEGEAGEVVSLILSGGQVVNGRVSLCSLSSIVPGGEKLRVCLLKGHKHLTADQ